MTNRQKIISKKPIVIYIFDILGWIFLPLLPINCILFFILLIDRSKTFDFYFSTTFENKLRRNAYFVFMLFLFFAFLIITSVIMFLILSKLPTQNDLLGALLFFISISLFTILPIMLIYKKLYKIEINYIKMSKKTKIIHLENYQKKSYPIKYIFLILIGLCLIGYLIFHYLNTHQNSQENVINYGEGNTFIDLTQGS